MGLSSRLERLRLCASAALLGTFALIGTTAYADEPGAGSAAATGAAGAGTERAGEPLALAGTEGEAASGAADKASGDASGAVTGEAAPASSASPAPVAPDQTSPASTAPAPKPKDYREGIGFAGLPLVNYDSDDGFGYGVKVAMYDYGKNQKPYKYQLALQLFFTTNHVQYHRLYFDAPRFMGTPWRFEVRLNYDKVRLSNYYGIGNTVGKPFPDVIEYNPENVPADLDAADARILNYYDSAQKEEPKFIVNLRRDLSGPFRLFTGLQVKKVNITPHTLEKIREYTDIDVTSITTDGQPYASFLEKEKPYGYYGGTMGYVQGGMIYDSRNREPSPDRGVFSEASLRGVISRSDDAGERETHSPAYAGINLTHRQFFSPVRTLVFAGRLIGDFMFGDVPFYELSSFGGSQDFSGLGGSVGTRGLVSGRYRGKVKVIITPEIRWTPITLYGGTQKFDIGLVAFVDAGRVWADYAKDGNWYDLHYTAGGGLRVAWNDNFLIRLDVGHALAQSNGFEKELAGKSITGFYLTFDQTF